MAQIRKTTYLCDSCGKEVEKKRDLSRFSVDRFESTGRWQNAAYNDLCVECEPKFLAAVSSFFTEEAQGVIAAMAR